MYITFYDNFGAKSYLLFSKCYESKDLPPLSVFKVRVHEVLKAENYVSMVWTYTTASVLCKTPTSWPIREKNIMTVPRRIPPKSEDIILTVHAVVVLK
jgi:hypothetical protein